MLMTHTQHVSSGLWGIALRFLLDRSECCIVREQAALLLINMTSQSSNTKALEDPLQGPVVTLDDDQVLTGLKALSALLHHYHFYQEVLTMLASYYPQPLIHPVAVAEHFSDFQFDFEVTLTTQGKVIIQC